MRSKSTDLTERTGNISWININMKRDGMVDIIMLNILPININGHRLSQTWVQF